MIQFKNIDVSFNGKTVFKDFQMDIEKGEKILFNAPSGKGKSTLFKLLLGFNRPDKGEIILNGKKLEKNSIMYFRKHIAYVSQDVDLRNDKVWDLILEIFSYKNNKHVKVTKDKVLDILKYFDFSKEIMEKKVGQLSGGERQRLGLAICILMDRDVWLLDEVTSGLDKEMKEKVVDYVLKQDKTVLIISHDKIWSKSGLVRIKEW